MRIRGLGFIAKIVSNMLVKIPKNLFILGSTRLVLNFHRTNLSRSKKITSSSFVSPSSSPYQNRFSKSGSARGTGTAILDLTIKLRIIPTVIRQVRNRWIKSSRVRVGGYSKRQKVHRSSTFSSKCATLAPTPSVLFLCLKRNSLKSLEK
jgi:hypothetical protein